MIVYRIADCNYIHDLTGKGAALYGSRWNSKNVYMVYTAQTGALAMLEAVVHIGKMPSKGLCMVTIDIPSNSIQTFPKSQLPADWYTNPPPDALKTIGNDFIKSGKYMALAVPSVVMMEENNYLLNPAHPAFSKVKIISERAIRIDDRLFPES